MIIRGDNYMTKLCDINGVAKEKLPPAFAEKSGIGSHYVDAFVKPMNTKLPDGTRVGCKRKGLKITLTVGTNSWTEAPASLPFAGSLNPVVSGSCVMYCVEISMSGLDSAAVSAS